MGKEGNFFSNLNAGGERGKELETTLGGEGKGEKILQCVTAQDHFLSAVPLQSSPLDLRLCEKPELKRREKKSPFRIGFREDA